MGDLFQPARSVMPQQLSHSSAQQTARGPGAGARRNGGSSAGAARLGQQHENEEGKEAASFESRLYAKAAQTATPGPRLHRGRRGRRPGPSAVGGGGGHWPGPAPRWRPARFPTRPSSCRSVTTGDSRAPGRGPAHGPCAGAAVAAAPLGSRAALAPGGEQEGGRAGRRGPRRAREDPGTGSGDRCGGVGVWGVR